MPDAESFVAAIAANPADDLPRLVFADWLDENGDPARAGFIRDHVALAKLRPGTHEYQTLFRRCADTLKANLPAWIKPACDAFGQPAEWKPGKAVGGRFPVVMRNDMGYPLYGLDISRGLIDHAIVRLPNVRHDRAVDELLRIHPISRLTVSLLMSAAALERLLTPRMKNVRHLSIRSGAFIETADLLFASDSVESVSRLDIPDGTVAERLVRSPMARRLQSIRAPLLVDLLSMFRDFPLDDRLQEFSGMRVTRTGHNGISSRFFVQSHPPPDEPWSALSLVAFRPTLKRLDLTRCGMTDDGLAAFARGEEWLRLQGLKLAGNLFGDRGWADFCRGWRTPELTYLDASRNRLTDAGAEMLSRSGMLKTLRVIDLRGNRIAGHGAVALARAVAEGKLNKLLLAGNPIGKREAATVKGLLGERVDI